MLTPLSQATKPVRCRPNQTLVPRFLLLHLFFPPSNIQTRTSDHQRFLNTLPPLCDLLRCSGHLVEQTPSRSLGSYSRTFSQDLAVEEQEEQKGDRSGSQSPGQTEELHEGEPRTARGAKKSELLLSAGCCLLTTPHPTQSHPEENGGGRRAASLE